MDEEQPKGEIALKAEEIIKALCDTDPAWARKAASGEFQSAIQMWARTEASARLLREYIDREPEGACTCTCALHVRWVGGGKSPVDSWRSLAVDAADIRERLGIPNVPAAG